MSLISDGLLHWGGGSIIRRRRRMTGAVTRCLRLLRLLMMYADVHADDQLARFLLSRGRGGVQGTSSACVCGTCYNMRCDLAIISFFS